MFPLLLPDGALSVVKYSEFWVRMDQQFGYGYARVWADNHVIRELGGRTASAALEDGETPKTVWRAIHGTLGLPANAEPSAPR